MDGKERRDGELEERGGEMWKSWGERFGTEGWMGWERLEINRVRLIVKHTPLTPRGQSPFYQLFEDWPEP